MSDLVKAIILGIVQAITEFLPISSSGHLILFREFLEFTSVDGLTFDVALHVGTLLAIVIYFRHDVARLLRGLVGLIKTTSPLDKDRQMAIHVIIACIPAVIVGLLLEDAIELYLRNPGVVVVTLVLGGILFLVVERMFDSVGKTDDLAWQSALVIGLAQTLALIPGVSRSGITIAVGMMMGLQRYEAARFSFLMATPILFGAGLKKALDVDYGALTGAEAGVIVAGVVTSAVFGWFVVSGLLKFLRSRRLDGFAYYRFALAAVVVFALARNWI